MTTETATVTCEARTGFYPGEWAELPLFCDATVGLTTWTDVGGFQHRACRHHRDALLRVYPRPAMAPPLVASPHCESGGHPGCTCDVCF